MRQKAAEKTSGGTDVQWFYIENNLGSKPAALYCRSASGTGTEEKEAGTHLQIERHGAVADRQLLGQLVQGGPHGAHQALHALPRDGADGMDVLRRDTLRPPQPSGVGRWRTAKPAHAPALRGTDSWPQHLNNVRVSAPSDLRPLGNTASLWFPPLRRRHSPPDADLS